MLCAYVKTRRGSQPQREWKLCIHQPLNPYSCCIIHNWILLVHCFNLQFYTLSHRSNKLQLIDYKLYTFCTTFNQRRPFIKHTSDQQVFHRHVINSYVTSPTGFSICRAIIGRALNYDLCGSRTVASSPKSLEVFFPLPINTVINEL